MPFKKADSEATRLKERNTLNFIESYLNYARDIKGDAQILNRINLDWIHDEIKVPNVTDRDTVVTLATISSNAYVRYPKDDDEKRKSDWIDLGDWDPNREDDDVNFGWDDIGLRGHVFVSKDNKTVVIGIKGTSGAGLPGVAVTRLVVTIRLMTICCFLVAVQELVICGQRCVIVMKKHTLVIKIV